MLGLITRARKPHSCVTSTIRHSSKVIIYTHLPLCLNNLHLHHNTLAYFCYILMVQGNFFEPFIMSHEMRTKINSLFVKSLILPTCQLSLVWKLTDLGIGEEERVGDKCVQSFVICSYCCYVSVMFGWEMDSCNDNMSLIFCALHPWVVTTKYFSRASNISCIVSNKHKTLSCCWGDPSVWKFKLCMTNGMTRSQHVEA